MKAKRTDDLHGFLKRNGPHRWTIVLGVGLAVLSGTLFPAPAQAAARVSLTLRGQWPGSASDVAVSDKYAYVAGSRQEGTNWIPGLQVIDVSSPASPVRAGGFDTSGDARRVQVVGTLAYVADGEAGLQILDVSNPASPSRVGGFDTEGSAQAVQVVGTLAYLVIGSALQVLDVSNPASPVALGKSQTPATDVEVVGTLAYAPHYFWGGLVHILDVSNPASPVEIGGIDLLIGRVHYEPYSVQVVGTLAYVTYGSAGLLHIFDVSDPASPLQVGEFDTSGDARGIQVVGTLAYVAETPRWTGSKYVGGGLEVVDVRNPANPVRVGGYDTSGSASDVAEVAVVGDFIYFADYQQGLLILEQSLAPAPPAEWVRVQTDPASTPRARHNHAMVYDEEREVILMHGGRLQDGTVLSDTWQWDGQTWTQLATNGPKVFQQSMAYDPSRGVTVLYGGRTCAGHSCPIGDTWEWDGQSWNLIEVGPTNPPPPVMGGMAYDPIRQKVIRQGGITAPDDTFDVGATWEWNGQTWTQIADGFIRGGHSLVFDPVRGRMIAFGGSSIGNTSPSPDTWEFDGNEWNLITTDGPSARFPFNKALVWDAFRNVGVLYGGAASASTWFDDTWEWDGVQWAQVKIPGPGPRGMHAMAYDAKRRKVVLFGGYRDCFRCEINETWEYGLAPLQLTSLERQPDGSLEIRWTGEAPPYQLQSRASLSAGDWQNEGEPTDTLTATVQADSAGRFYRVLSLFGSAP